MTVVKERIIGALALMNDTEAEKVWVIIQEKFSAKEKSWEDIETVVPDEYDLQMLKEIAEDEDCREMVSAREAYKVLGIE